MSDLPTVTRATRFGATVAIIGFAPAALSGRTSGPAVAPLTVP